MSLLPAVIVARVAAEDDDDTAERVLTLCHRIEETLLDSDVLSELVTLCDAAEALMGFR